MVKIYYNLKIKEVRKDISTLQHILSSKSQQSFRLSLLNMGFGVYTIVFDNLDFSILTFQLFTERDRKFTFFLSSNGSLFQMTSANYLTMCLSGPYDW